MYNTLCSVLLCLILGGGNICAQISEPDTSSRKPIIVINADKTQGFDKGLKSILTGNVKLRQDSTVIYANRVNLESESNTAEAFGQVVIQRHDTTNAFCDELLYDGNLEYATMSGDVVLQNGEQKLYSDLLEYDMLANVAHYTDKALMTDGLRLISSKRGQYFIDSNLVVFVDSVVVAGPDYTMKTDSLHFNTLTNTAYFVAPVRMKSKENSIYCEAGYYDLVANYAVLRQNAQFSSPTQEGTADSILYNGVTEDVTMLGNAWFKEAAKEASADQIDYQKSKDKVILKGNVVYQDEEQSANGAYMEYILSTGAFKTDGRANMKQGSQKLAADRTNELADGKTIHAQGKVVWHDSVQQVSLFCEDAYINKIDKTVKAFGERLLLVSQLEGDSLFLTADTLYTATIKQPDSSELQVLRAFHNVVGYKKDLQFVADSISFDELDSLFKIFGNPVIWSDTSRFYGDTIYIQLANDVIDELFIKDNAFIVNQNNPSFFNQVKGREITAKFENRELHHTHVKGNAESIYYAVDDGNAYIGVNKIACSEMELEFEEKQIGKIRFYRKPTSAFYPMQDVDHKKIQLEGFSFDETFRAKSPLDIYRVYELKQGL